MHTYNIKLQNDSTWLVIDSQTELSPLSLVCTYFKMIEMPLFSALIDEYLDLIFEIKEDTNITEFEFTLSANIQLKKR